MCILLSCIFSINQVLIINGNLGNLTFRKTAPEKKPSESEPEVAAHRSPTQFIKELSIQELER